MAPNGIGVCEVRGEAEHFGERSEQSRIFGFNQKGSFKILDNSFISELVRISFHFRVISEVLRIYNPMGEISVSPIFSLFILLFHLRIFHSQTNCQKDF